MVEKQSSDETQVPESSAEKKSTPGLHPGQMSLLWPARVITGDGREYHHITPNAWHDLGLDAIVKSFASDLEHRRELESIIGDLCQDIEVVRFRQEILKDMMENHLLVQRLEKLLPIVDALGRFSYRVVKDLNTLHEITWRTGELQSIADCIHGLQMTFEEAGDLSSKGLISLRRLVYEIWEDPAFQNLAEELPEILSQLRACKSVTIGVNLDQYLRPVEATLLSVNEEKFTNQSMLNRLFGLNAGKEGIAPTAHSSEARSEWSLRTSHRFGFRMGCGTADDSAFQGSGRYD